MRLYLVRHAQSTANVLRTLNTALPGPPLTDLGRQQADALARRLSGEPVAAVYASHAIRAQQTAQPLAAALSMDVSPLEGVHEVNVGELEDRGDPEAIETYFKVVHPWTQGDLSPAMPGGESGHEVRERFLGAVERLRTRHAQQHADGVVVVVSHGGAIRLGADWLSRNVTPEVADKGLLPNTGVVRLEALSDGGWHCLDWAGMALG